MWHLSPHWCTSRGLAVKNGRHDLSDLGERSPMTTSPSDHPAAQPEAPVVRAAPAAVRVNVGSPWASCLESAGLNPSGSWRERLYQEVV